MSNKPETNINTNNNNVTLETNSLPNNNHATQTKSNTEETILKSNKIPHPPPQSTRPSTSSAARKIRHSSAVKNNLQQKKALPSNPNSLKINNLGGESSNEEDAQNSSSKTLIDYSTFSSRKDRQFNNESSKALKTNNSNPIVKSPSSGFHSSSGFNVSLIKPKDENLLTDSSSGIYSFSSKPKPVSDRDINEASSLSTQKIYDPRRYSTATGSTHTKKEPNENFKEKNHEIIDNKVNKISGINLASIAKDSLSFEPRIEYTKPNEKFVQDDNYLMDSFEANMLLQMKAEMEAPSTIFPIKNDKNSTKNQKTLSLTNNNNKLFDEDQARVLAKEFEKQKSLDMDYIEMLQREASGLQSPLSDENNQTTSEKYNYDAMTSSIEETSNSLSKKTVIF